MPSCSTLLPKPLVATYSLTGRGHKHPENNIECNEDFAGSFDISVDSGDKIHAIYLMDGHGIPLPENLDINTPLTFKSGGQRFTARIVKILPSVLACTLNLFHNRSPLPPSPSPLSHTILTALQTSFESFHVHLNKSIRSDRTLHSLAKENGATLLLAFTLRNHFFVLTMGDSTFLFVDAGTGEPIHVWQRFEDRMTKKKRQMCSYPDSLNNYPLGRLPGQTKASVAADFAAVRRNVRRSKASRYRLLSSKSRFSLGMINCIGNFNHHLSMVKPGGRTNVYMFDGINVSTGQDTLLLIGVSDGITDQIPIKIVSAFGKRSKGIETGLKILGKWCATGCDFTFDLKRQEEQHIINDGEDAYDKDNKNKKTKSYFDEVQGSSVWGNGWDAREAREELEYAVKEEDGQDEQEGKRNWLTRVAKSVVNAAILRGGRDDATCVVGGFFLREDENDDTEEDEPGMIFDAPCWSQNSDTSISFDN